MSALQIAWLTNHYEQGKITQDEFTSLYQRITLSEKETEKQSAQAGGKSTNRAKVARLHPETRRTLARVRIFKKLVKAVNYTIALALISVIYLSAEHYQVTGTLPAFSAAGLEKLLTQEPLKPLPSDIKLAAEYLMQQPEWDEQHINQLTSRWQNLLISERQRYNDEHWFQGLKLALSLRIAEKRKLAKGGDDQAIHKSVLLTQLSEQLENTSA